MRDNRARRQRGLTLIEIIAVIGIIAILSAIGIPNFASYQRSLRLREANNGLAQALQLAASQASNEGREVKVQFLLNAAAGPDLRLEAGGTTLNEIALEGDAMIVSASSPSVFFNVRGRPRNTDTIVLTTKLGDSSGTVRLLTTGKTVVQ